MTKLRPALTYELALTRIAGTIGWERCSSLLGQNARTIRNWSDPDTAAGIRMDAAELLDLEHQAAGGKGAPMFECYALRLKSSAANMFGSAEAISEAVARAAKEGGEGIAAAIHAARPDATAADYAIAERELEEAIAANTDALRSVRARSRSERDMPKGEV